MKLTSRKIIDSWILDDVNLTSIERVLSLQFGSLKSLLEEEGPAPPETEVLLNMINSVPSLLHVAEKNFDHRK